MNIPIIFENNDILIIHKPTAIVVHPFDYSTEETVVDFLLERYPKMFTITNEKKLQDSRIIELGGIVHKLDRDTSGVMVIAKNQKAFDELKTQFRNHIPKKTYLALVEGIIDLRQSRESGDSDTFTIDAPLGRNKKDYKQQVNPTNPRGELRDAVTDVRVITRNNNSTLVELTPKTGRTHQLRAHMAYIGHPIVGDKAYGSTQESERIMLHAQQLTFSLFGEHYTFEVAPDPLFGEEK